MSVQADRQVLTPAGRRRRIVLGLLRALATTVVLVALYYLLPLDHLHTVPLVLVGGLVILLAVSLVQLRAIIRARYPAVRAIEALAAYAQLAEQRGDHAVAQKYSVAAKQMAAKWLTMADDGDHYRLAFDKTGTWSQKYNLVWDELLGLHVFSPEVARKEIAFYKSHMNAYGLPLDNRATYTKLDWTIWTATLAKDQADFTTLVKPILPFLNKTPDRVPMSDWYDTISAKQIGFQARSVVGGVYIKMLADPKMWEKWVRKSQN